jgi:hypothetical protein
LTGICVLYESEKHIGMTNHFFLMQNRCENYDASFTKRNVFYVVIGLFYGTAGIYVMSNVVPCAVYLFIYSFILQSVLRQIHSLYHSDFSTKAHLVLLLSIPSSHSLKVI